MKLFIFEEMIHEDDELAHAGCQGDQRFFTCGAEALIKVLEDPVIADGAEGGHIKGTTHWSSTAADMPPTRVVAAIAIIGGHAGQGGSRLWVEFAEFRHFRQYGGGHDRADPGDGLQTRGFARQFGVLGNEKP